MPQFVLTIFHFALKIPIQTPISAFVGFLSETLLFYHLSPLS